MKDLPALDPFTTWHSLSNPSGRFAQLGPVYSMAHIWWFLLIGLVKWVLFTADSSSGLPGWDLFTTWHSWFTPHAGCGFLSTTRTHSTGICRYLSTSKLNELIFGSWTNQIPYLLPNSDPPKCAGSGFISENVDLDAGSLGVQFYKRNSSSIFFRKLPFL